MIDSRGRSKKLVCFKCSNTVSVDSDFRHDFYCHMCGSLMHFED